MRRLGSSTDFSGFFLVGKFFCFLRFAALLTLIEDSSRTSIRTLNESGTRCLLGSDTDELGLLSKARPLKAQPLNAVTQTRDGFAGCNALLPSWLRSCNYLSMVRWMFRPL